MRSRNCLLLYHAACIATVRHANVICVRVARLVETSVNASIPATLLRILCDMSLAICVVLETLLSIIIVLISLSGLSLLYVASPKHFATFPEQLVFVFDEPAL